MAVVEDHRSNATRRIEKVWMHSSTSFACIESSCKISRVYGCAPHRVICVSWVSKASLSSSARLHDGHDAYRPKAHFEIHGVREALFLKMRLFDTAVKVRRGRDIARRRISQGRRQISCRKASMTCRDLPIRAPSQQIAGHRTLPIGLSTTAFSHRYIDTAALGMRLIRTGWLARASMMHEFR